MHAKAPFNYHNAEKKSIQIIKEEEGDERKTNKPPTKQTQIHMLFRWIKKYTLKVDKRAVTTPKNHSPHCIKETPTIHSPQCTNSPACTQSQQRQHYMPKVTKFVGIHNPKVTGPSGLTTWRCWKRPRGATSFQSPWHYGRQNRTIPRKSQRLCEKYTTGAGKY